MEFINKKKFAKTALDAESETFMMHISVLEPLISGMTIYFSRKTQITGGNVIQIAALKQNKALNEVPTKYLDFSDVISEEKNLVLLE